MEQKHYYAFISHSSADAKVALWLRNQLEKYPIPAMVRRTYNVPKRLRPIFCYQTDLAGNKLHDALKRSLDDSEFLIVVCSPASAQSIYVNNEIEYFIEIGKADKIIPFIISGEPYASLNNNPQNECFAPAMIKRKQQGNELRGINFNESKKQLGSKKAAVVNIIASMLGVRFDALWNRYKKRQKRIRTIVGFIIAFVILEIIGAWNMYRPIYKYYADYTDIWGFPQGIIELTEEQRSARTRMWMFEYRRVPYGEPNYYSWRVNKVMYVSSTGIPQDIEDSEMTDRYPIQEYEYYKNNGYVSRINCYDSNWQMIVRQVLTEEDDMPATIVDFVHSKEQYGNAFINANLTSMSIGQMDAGQAKSKIVRFIYRRDRNGYITQKTYHANNDNDIKISATADIDGVYGISYIRDTLGRPIQFTYLGKEHQPICIKNSIAGRRYEYDDFGNISKTTFIDLNGNPVLNELAFAIITDISDKKGNICEEHYYDENGNSCMNTRGFASVQFVYDETGLPIEESYYDTQGQPCMSSEGASIIRTFYHIKIKEYEKIFLDTLKRFCYGYEDIGRVVYTFNETGQIASIRFTDSLGTLRFSKYGTAKHVYQYDSLGNIIELSCFGEDDQPCLCTDGFSKIVFQYNELNYPIEIAYRDVNDSLCTNSNNVAIERYNYDRRGNVRVESYFGTDGHAIMSKEGYAVRFPSYDEFGRDTSSVYLDADMNIVELPDTNSQ